MIKRPENDIVGPDKQPYISRLKTLKYCIDRLEHRIQVIKKRFPYAYHYTGCFDSEKMKSDAAKLKALVDLFVTTVEMPVNEANKKLAKKMKKKDTPEGGTSHKV